MKVELHAVLLGQPIFHESNASL